MKKKYIWITLPVVLALLYCNFWDRQMKQIKEKVIHQLESISPEGAKPRVYIVANPLKYQVEVIDPVIKVKEQQIKTEGSVFISVNPFDKSITFSSKQQKTSLCLGNTPYLSFSGAFNYTISDVDEAQKIIKQVHAIPGSQMPDYLKLAFCFNGMQVELNSFKVNSHLGEDLASIGHFKLGTKKANDGYTYHSESKDILVAKTNNNKNMGLEPLIFDSSSKGTYQLQIPEEVGNLAISLQTERSECTTKTGTSSGNSTATIEFTPWGALTITHKGHADTKLGTFNKDDLIESFKTLCLKGANNSVSTYLDTNREHICKCMDMILSPIEEVSPYQDTVNFEYFVSNYKDPLDSKHKLTLNQWKLIRGNQSFDVSGAFNFDAKALAFGYTLDLTCHDYSKSFETAVDFLPNTLAASYSMMLTTMLEPTPLTPQLKMSLQEYLEHIAKKKEGNSITFSMTGSEKGIEKIGNLSFNEYQEYYQALKPRLATEYTEYMVAMNIPQQYL